MIGKGTTEIAARRDIKRRVCELLVACAEDGPKAIASNGVLEANEAGNVNVRVRDFVWKLSAEEKDALRTAKGCTKLPTPSDRKMANASKPLLNFLELPVTGSVQVVGCMAGYVRDGLDWAKQVALANPNSRIDWPALKHRIDIAAANVKLAKKLYFQDPAVREPNDPEEAFYWLVSQSLRIKGYENVPEAQCEAEWKRRAARMAERLRENPNIQGLLASGFAKAYDLAEKWYIDGDVPEEVR